MTPKFATGDLLSDGTGTNQRRLTTGLTISRLKPMRKHVGFAGCVKLFRGDFKLGHYRLRAASLGPRVAQIRSNAQAGSLGEAAGDLAILIGNCQRQKTSAQNLELAAGLGVRLQMLIDRIVLGNVERSEEIPNQFVLHREEPLDRAGSPCKSPAVKNAREFANVATGECHRL